MPSPQAHLWKINDSVYVRDQHGRIIQLTLDEADRIRRILQRMEHTENGHTGRVWPVTARIVQ